MSNRFRICAVAFSAIALSILLAALAATLAIHSGASEALRVPFTMICHGLAAHSFSVAGTAMPLCARCVGIYLGIAIGVLLSAAGLRRRTFNETHLALALAPIVVDGVTQALRLRESTNALRIATGVLAGIGFLLYVMRRIDDPDRANFQAAANGASEAHSNG